LVRDASSVGGSGGVQVLGSLAAGGGLGDVALGCVQVGDVLDERDKARHESYLDE
jgi:hypothetical protein